MEIWSRQVPYHSCSRASRCQPGWLLAPSLITTSIPCLVQLQPPEYTHLDHEIVAMSRVRDEATRLCEGTGGGEGSWVVCPKDLAGPGPASP